MPKEKGKHLDFDDRCKIEEMLKDGASFRCIAKKLNVSTAAISNEIKANRMFGAPKAITGNAQTRCSRYSECRIVMLCDKCTSKAASCKRCGKIHCYNICKEYTQFRCRELEHAPFVCSRCPKRRMCCYAKARHIASKAQVKHDRRISAAHEGVAFEESRLLPMAETVRKLLSQGQSLEVIWAVHGGEFPVSVRTFYNYMDRGLLGLPT